MVVCRDDWLDKYGRANTVQIQCKYTSKPQLRAHYGLIMLVTITFNIALGGFISDFSGSLVVKVSSFRHRKSNHYIQLWYPPEYHTTIPTSFPSISQALISVILSQSWFPIVYIVIDAVVKLIPINQITWYNLWTSKLIEYLKDSYKLWYKHWDSVFGHLHQGLKESYQKWQYQIWKRHLSDVNNVSSILRQYTLHW